MKNKTETMHLFLEPNKKAESPNDSPFNFFLVSSRHKWYMNDDEQIRIDDVEVSYSVPTHIGEDDLAVAAIKQLKERQEKVRADAHRRVEEIEEHISRLSLLTHQSGNPLGRLI